MFHPEMHAQYNARKIIGNENAGYKIAICQRDIAIYGSLFLFGVLFILAKKKIHPITLGIWILWGIAPITLDGITQLVSSVGFPIPIIGYWESNPVVRSFTGALFGSLSGWYVLPSMQKLINKEK